MIDWRQVITTTLIASFGTMATFYITVKQELAEIRGMITSRVAQREAQIANINQNAAEMNADINSLRNEFGTCRETVARLGAEVNLLKERK